MVTNDTTTLEALEQELTRVQRERRRLEAEEAHLVAMITEEEEKWYAHYGS